jgi:hypothetical protein
MIPIRRFVFNAVAAGSLLVCLVTVFLWVRSYSARIDLGLQVGGFAFEFDCSRGEFAIARETRRPGQADGWRLNFREPIDLLESLRSGKLGVFRFDVLDFAGYSFRRKMWNGQIFLWPCGAVFLASAVVPAVWITRWRPPPKAGMCRRCGYDLRATPERCPECGTSPKSGDGISGRDCG